MEEMSSDSHRGIEGSVSPPSELPALKELRKFIYWIKFWVIKTFMNWAQGKDEQLLYATWTIISHTNDILFLYLIKKWSHISFS